MSIQMMLLGTGAVATKTYVDDVFSTFLYRGNGANNRAITGTGVNLSENGGLVWIKSRSDTEAQVLVDSAQGVNKVLNSSTNGGSATQTNRVSAFGTDGFTLGATSDWSTNRSGAYDYASWSFRKSPMFDVVTYTGNGNTPQAIAHNLGSMPGMVIVKKTSASGDWMVWHRDLGASSRLELNQNGSAGSGVWGSTEPTSTHFYVNGATATGASGSDYIAYVFAGGESTAATATSCNFLGTSASGNYDNNKINVGTTSGTKTADLVYGTGDFTMEAWVKCESSSNTYRRVFHHGQEWHNGTSLGLNWDHNSNQNQFSLWSYNLSSSGAIVHSQTHNFDDDGQWHHVAVSRQSGTFRIFVDGVLEGTNSSYSGSTENVSTNYLTIGATHNDNVQECFKGNISNVRIVKGTAVYTSSFRPPTEPLTNITNTKLLCCNGSSVTSATVTPITLTVGDSSVTASSNSPFDDPAGFVFGESGSENAIKTGSYEGNSTANHEIYVGWEPQWWLVKNVTDSQNWQLLDSMRGWVSDGNDQYLVPNNNSIESPFNFGNPTSTGFNLSSASSNWQNESGKQYVYMAIRRPDGYVGKPPELGTDVFAMDTGAGSSTIPNWDSGFPVDFALARTPATADNWWTIARLTGAGLLQPNLTNSEVAGGTNWVSDSNVGWGKAYNSTYQSWMWKRHAGFDVVTYEGDGVTGRQISHNLSKSPEMMWIKNRSSSNGWIAFHKGLGGGTNPSHKFLQINSDTAEADSTLPFNDTEPTSTNFTVGGWGLVNNTNDNHIAMLFASISGISAVGSYTGNGSSSGPTITTGFTPRFILIKSVAAESWWVLDTLRGLGTSSDKLLQLNQSFSQGSQVQNITTSSTGFTIIRDWAPINQNNTTMLYYAHA